MENTKIVSIKMNFSIEKENGKEFDSNESDRFKERVREFIKCKSMLFGCKVLLIE